MFANEGNPLLDAMGHFLGYGRINAKYSFFGIEEGGISINDALRNQIYLSACQQRNEGEHFYPLSLGQFSNYYAAQPLELEREINMAEASTLYSRYRQIFSTLIHNHQLHSNFDLWKEDVLLGNLLPFSRPSTDMDYSPIEMEWLKNHRLERERMVANYILGLPGDNLVFLFGVSAWWSIFENNNISFEAMQFENSTENGNRTYYRAWDIMAKRPYNKIYLLYHPSPRNKYGLTVDQANELCEAIQNELHH